KPQFYLYKCNCPGKVHDVPYGIHQKIELQGHKFTCKICKQAITFFQKHS
ncbi:TPA: hemerythrin family non-heme iron protein, partial [Campylobacter coli]|nr:hemerythrin family non-heme iron protein [Campylobacter coli]HEC2778229.1 hemerythrin family non-heme iron protein [Campylobacter coli]